MNNAGIQAAVQAAMNDGGQGYNLRNGMTKPKNSHGTGKPKGKFPKFHQSLDVLAAGLGLTKTHTDTWLEGPLFQPYWDDYKRSSLDPTRAAVAAGAAKTVTGKHLKSVLSCIREGERDGKRTFSRRIVDKTNWTPLEYNAYFLYQCRAENKADQAGIFYGKGLEKDSEYNAIWQAKMYLTNLTSPTKEQRRLENAAKNKRGSESGDPQHSPQRDADNDEQSQHSDRTIESDNERDSDTGRAAADQFLDELEQAARDGQQEPGNNGNGQGAGPEVKMEDNEEQDNPGNNYAAGQFNAAYLQQHGHAHDDPIELDPNEQSDVEMPDNDETASGSGGPNRDTEEPNSKDEPDDSSSDSSDSSGSSSYRTSQSQAEDGFFPQNWDEILQEKTPDYQENNRFWKIAIIRYLVKQDTIPPYMQQVFSQPDNNLLNRLQAESREWHQALEELLGDTTIRDPEVARQELEELEKVEDFLNTTPTIDMDIQDVMQRLDMDGTTERPRLRGMGPNVSLLPLQVIGIDSLVTMRETLTAALLADKTGLGKTYQMAGVVSHAVQALSVRKATAEAIGQPIPNGRPTLVLVPASLVIQTQRELIDVFAPDYKIYMYHGDPRSAIAGRLKVEGLLHRQHAIFSQFGEPEKRIVVSSHSTFTHRHGAKIMELDNGQRPHSLKNLWDTVACDECHAAKNPETDLNKTLCLLEPTFTLLMSATPAISRVVTDFKGYLKIIKPRIPPLDNYGQLFTPEHARQSNPYVSGNRHPSVLIDEHMTKKHIFSNDDETIAALYLKKAASQFMVRRTYTTVINGKQVGADLPKLFRRAITTNYEPITLAKYRKYAAVHLDGLVRKLEDGTLVWDMGKARRLRLISTWLGFEWVQDKMTAKTVPTLKADPDWLHSILETVHEQRTAAGETLGWTVPARDHTLRQTQIVLQESPKLQALLGTCSDTVVRHRQKAIIFVMLPAQQLLVTTLLRNVGIDAKSISADMKIDERSAVIEEFNTTDDCEVLVLTYAISACGLNLQAKCFQVMQLDVAISRDTEAQATGRVLRFGQRHDVMDWNFACKDTFDDRQLANVLRKAIPNIITELNDSKVKVSVGQDQNDMVRAELRGWSITAEGKPVLDGSQEEADAANDGQITQADIETLAAGIFRLQQGRQFVF